MVLIKYCKLTVISTTTTIILGWVWMLTTVMRRQRWVYTHLQKHGNTSSPEVADLTFTHTVNHCFNTASILELWWPMNGKVDGSQLSRTSIMPNSHTMFTSRTHPVHNLYDYHKCFLECASDQMEYNILRCAIN